jgi:hypothetical protein
MASIPEIIKRAKNLLWMDEEEEDIFQADKIISAYNKKGYDGRMLKDYKEVSNGEFTVTFNDHPLLKIYEYFYNKYGDGDGMAFYYCWSWKVGLVPLGEGNDEQRDGNF